MRISGLEIPDLDDASLLVRNRGEKAPVRAECEKEVVAPPEPGSAFEFPDRASGEGHDENAKFCKYCGATLEEEP